MNDREKLKAYENMQEDIEKLFYETVEKTERLKKENKTKTVSYKEAVSWKFYYKVMLDMYKKYGLK